MSWRLYVILGLPGAIMGFAKAAAPPPTLSVRHVATVPGVTADAQDPAWSAVQWADLQPALGEEPARAARVPTQVAVVWDEDFLFVRFRCQGTGAAVHGSVHDANHHEGEAVEVFLDPSGDQREFMELQLSPAGGVLDKWWTLDAPLAIGPDGLLTPDYIRDHQRGDLGWTLTGLRVATAPWKTDGREAGWIADLAVPWHAMAHPPLKAGSTLRAHFLRLAHPPAQTVGTSLTWAAVPVGRPHRAPALMGTLELAPAKPEAGHVPDQTLERSP